jgi:hypothetical protein
MDQVLGLSIVQQNGLTFSLELHTVVLTAKYMARKVTNRCIDTRIRSQIMSRNATTHHTSLFCSRVDLVVLQTFTYRWIHLLPPPISQFLRMSQHRDNHFSNTDRCLRPAEHVSLIKTLELNNTRKISEITSLTSVRATHSRCDKQEAIISSNVQWRAASFYCSQHDLTSALTVILTYSPKFPLNLVSPCLVGF